MHEPARPIVISPADPLWPQRFRTLGGALRERLGADAVRIDHIGSTAVPGLAAKDVVDVQITVARLDVTDGWPAELLPGLVRSTETSTDHRPAGAEGDDADWAKRYWSNSHDIHVHVRSAGAPNQRYALLFRDYLRSDKRAALAYAATKEALADVTDGDRGDYYAVKDPVCDLIIAGAEQWALRTGWSPPPSDA
jgi:GrpB-like predicted nucleotidyltransferase (UPF0157 family)